MPIGNKKNRKNNISDADSDLFETLVQQKRVGSTALPKKKPGTVMPADSGKKQSDVVPARDTTEKDEDYFYDSSKSEAQEIKYGDISDSPDGKSEGDSDTEAGKTVGKAPTLFAVIAGAILAAELVFLSVLLLKVNLLPVIIFIAAIFLLIAIGVGIIALLWNRNRVARFIIGVILSVLLMLSVGYGSILMAKAWNTAQKVTTVEPITTNVGVYVRYDNNITDISGTSDYLFGILKSKDREDANQALQLVANDLGKSINVAEYDSVTDLILALYSGNIQAAVFESYHVEMLMSMESDEYVALASTVKQLCSYSVEKLSNDSDRPEDIGVSPIHQKAEEPDDVQESHAVIVYISGIDTYGSVNVQSRSDVNILAVINPETHQVLLASTPRDYYVYTTVSGSYRDKLTHAGLWGPECSMGSLEYLYDCNIDYYFRVNFSGFVKIVDALGGVDFSYKDDGSNPRHLDGTGALYIARDRTECGSDYNRGKNQMRMIKAVINKVLSPELLYNFDDVLSAVEGSFQTTMPYDMISDLVKKQIAENPTWEIITVAADGEGATDIPYAFIYYGNEGGMYAYVCEPNYDSVNSIHDKIAAMERNERVSAE